MKKFPLILTLASSLLLAACGVDPVSSSPTPTPVSSDEPVVSSDEPVVSSDPASSEAAPVVTTIADIVSGKHPANTIVTVSGVINFVTFSSETTRDFWIQDGKYAIAVNGARPAETIAEGNSVTVTGRYFVPETMGLTGYAYISTGSSYPAVAASEKTYTYETITAVSSLDDFGNNLGCYAELSPLSYVSQGETNRIFNAKFNDLQFRIHFSTSIEQTQREEFIASISGGAQFSFKGPLIYNTKSTYPALEVNYLSQLALLTE